MPVASVVRPSDGSETSLGWAPVVPFFIVMRKSIPDFESIVPFPQDLWDLRIFTPCANFEVTWVLLYELKTFGLGAKDVMVLSIDLFPRFAEMFLGSASDVIAITCMLFSIFEFNIFKLFWLELEESLLIIVLIILALSFKKL